MSLQDLFRSFDRKFDWFNLNYLFYWGKAILMFESVKSSSQIFDSSQDTFQHGFTLLPDHFRYGPARPLRLGL